METLKDTIPQSGLPSYEDHASPRDLFGLSVPLEFARAVTDAETERLDRLGLAALLAQNEQ